MKIEGHAVLPPPSDEDVRAYSLVEKVDEATAEARLLEQRARYIEAERADPLRYGWESPMWHVCDALLGWELDESWGKLTMAQFGLAWEQAALRVRTALGFARPVKRLLILGANRSGKSEFSAKRGVQLMLSDFKKKVLWAHEMSTRSNEEQQPLVYKYLPLEIKGKPKATEREYVKFKEKTGFSEGSFILGNMSMGVFRNYTQEMEKALEGLELDAALADERTPTDWVESLKYRTATRDGIVIVGFTPVNGYSPTVKAFCDSMTVTWQSVGFCLPDDGGGADLPAALGLRPDELAIIERCKEEKIAPPCPAAVPEDVFAEVLRGKQGRNGQIGKRSFEMVPRVARGFEPDTAIVWFHGRDNPYGGPATVMRNAIGSRKGRDEVRMRVYGIATKAQGSVFAKFRRKTHVMKDAEIPTKGTDFMFLDPHPSRNNFMVWIRACENEKNFTVREWPGNYEIPGVGIPDPWAKPSGRKNGINDGDRGESQNGFGFGLCRIKFEIARLERWEAWAKWRRDHAGKGVSDFRFQIPEPTDVAEWDERLGAEQPIARRLMDSRAFLPGAVRENQAVTLRDEFEEIGLYFEAAPGTGVSGGLDLLVSAFDFNEQALPSVANSPRHFCAESCINSIFAFENYQNVEGDKGAMKEPIDCHRWFYTAGLGFEPDSGPRRRANVATGRWEKDAGNGANSTRGTSERRRSGLRVKGRFAR